MAIGWLREVKSINFNKSFEALRVEFRREANESDIFDESKKQVTELMNTMFTPLISSMNKRYNLRVIFKDVIEIPVPVEG